MTSRRPLVQKTGRLAELPSSDTLLLGGIELQQLDEPPAPAVASVRLYLDASGELILVRPDGSTARIDVTAVDVTAPTITSENPSGSYVEGVAIGGTLTANETVTWAKAGADVAAVTLDAETGVWSLEATDFETKVSYSWTFTATDGAGNSSDQAVAISITQMQTVTTAFGANTLAGAGGVDVLGASIVSGDSSGHWQITGGKITPSSTGASAGLNAGPYSMVLDNGQAVEITVTADEYSVGNRTELLAVKALGAGAYTGKTIRLRDDGDYIGDGTAIDWSNETPATEVTITGDTHRGPLTPGFDFSNSARIHVEALKCHRLIDPLTESGTSSVITINSSTAIVVNDCEISADPLADLITAAIANADTGLPLAEQTAAQTLTGVGYTGTIGVTGITVTNNYIHDVNRSVKLQGPGINFSNNLCVDALVNFGSIVGVMDNQTIVGNRGIGIWHNDADPGAPHSGLFGWQPGDTNSANITIEGNIWAVGTNRKDALGDLHGYATGPKFNVAGTGILSNVSVRNNVVICNGNIAWEFANVADAAMEWNTLAFTEDTIDGTGGLPLLYYYNIGAGCVIRNNVAGQVFAGTGTGNDESLVVFNNEEIPRANYSSKFTGPFTGVTLENVLDRFAPLAGSTMLTADPKRGAIGTGYYDWDTDTGTWPEPSGPGEAVAGFVGRFTDNGGVAGGGTYTIPISIGAAHADRVVVVAVDSTVALGSATLGGHAMTLGATTASSSSSGVPCIYIYYLATGGLDIADATTASLVLTNTSTTAAARCDTLVYACYPSSKTPVDSDFKLSNSSTPAQITALNVEAGGFLITAGNMNSASTDRTLTWSGAESVTIDANDPTEGSLMIYGGHAEITEAISGTLTMDAVNSGSKRLAAISFGAPA